MRAKSLWILLSVAAVTTSAFAVACGDDSSSNNNPNGTADSGPDGNLANTGDAGCTFAGFVTNLIGTQTTASAIPSTDLGDGCTPSTSQDDFKSLFPAH